MSGGNKCSSVASRRGIRHKKGVCFVFLHSGHIAKNCLANMKCLKRHKAYHFSICDTGVTPKVDFVNPKPLTTVNHPPETVPPTFVEENATHIIFVDVQTSVLLQTARAVVSRLNNLSHSVNVRLIWGISTILHSEAFERHTSAKNFEPRKIGY